MFIRTPDNQLIFFKNKQVVEILPYVNQASLTNLKWQIKEIELAYYHEVCGVAPFIFLSRLDYRVLKMTMRTRSIERIAKNLSVSKKVVRESIEKLKKIYKIWAHDMEVKDYRDCTEKIKVYLSDVTFSQLMNEEDYDDLDEFIPGDNGKQATDTLSSLEAMAILEVLTPVQKQTALLLAAGYSPAEIGKKLGVSNQEVYQKIARMRKKLQSAGYQPNVREEGK